MKFFLDLASPDALLLQDALRGLALPTSHCTDPGVPSIDGAMEVAGDRDLQLEEELGNEGG